MNVRFNVKALDSLIDQWGLSGKKALIGFLGADENGKQIVKYDAIISWYRTKNPSSPSEKVILALCEKFGVPRAYFYGDMYSEIDKKTSQSQSNGVDIEVLEMVAGFGSEGVLDPDFKTCGTISIPSQFAQGLIPKYTRIIQCVGDSMLPLFENGDFLIVDLIAGRSGWRQIDGVYLVRVGDMIFIKRVAFLPRGGLRLISINSAYGEFIIGEDGDQTNFEVLGRVRGKISVKIEIGLIFDDQGIR